MKRVTIVIFVIGTLSLALTPASHQQKWSESTPVSEALFELGEKKPAHYRPEVTPTMIRSGEEFVKLGRSTDASGSKTSYISKYYTCTSCHNVKREDPNLSVVDQDARLKYAMDHKLPYLQGSTFWGIVNRETWYNDDYVLKYGDLVKKAAHSLEESIKLCATVCSQGRPLEKWELDNILAYLWSLEMTIGDLDLSTHDWEKLNSASVTTDEQIALIKAKYLQKSPATFASPPADKRQGYTYEGDAKLGKGIYELGCQHCHRPNGESDVVFENNQLSLNWLGRHLTDNTQQSIYEIIRKGTYSAYGHQEYMPHYTLEKMSDQQIEHLRAYIESENM